MRSSNNQGWVNNSAPFIWRINMTPVAKNLIAAFIIKKIIGAMDDNIVKNRMMAPGGNMGLQRSMMPQIANNRLSEYFRFMKSQSITFKNKTMKTSDLRLVQAEYNKDKVLKLMKVYRSEEIGRASCRERVSSPV